MVLTEYYEELVLKYFISVIGEFKNGDFGFHVFVPFINLPRNPKAALGSKVFVYMKNGQFVYMWYSFNLFKPFRKLTWHRAAAPKWYGANTLITTAPGLDGPFANATYWIKPWQFI